MTFSVIIPIYKVEKYLSKCIDSVLTQSYDNFEVILVDDGSPDKCPELCDDWAQKDNRIRVVHKKNGGLSSARNAGLDIAKGEYVIFLDSDDWWCDKCLLFNLKDRIDKFDEDLILFGLKILRVDGTYEVTRSEYDVEFLNKHKKHETLNYLYSANMFPGSSCIICSNRTLIEKNKLRFKVGVTAEDYEWAISLLVLCNSIGAIIGAQYIYVRREGSITTSAKLSGVIGTMNALDFYKKQNFRNDGITKFLSRIYLISIMSFNQLPKADKKVASKLLFAHLYILKEAKQKSYYWFVRLMGFAISSKAIRNAYKIVR